METFIDIRKATLNDLPRLLEIENLSFKTKWQEKDLIYELQENPVSNFNVITFKNLVVGFIDFWITFDSATIAQVAIHPTFRKNHFASLLIEDMIDDCYASRVQFITLEVRVSNESAINLYLKNKFKKEIIKPHYYTDGEDAIYMIRKVD